MKLATIEKSDNSVHTAVLLSSDHLLDLEALKEVFPIATNIPSGMKNLLAGGSKVLADIQKCVEMVEGMQNDEQTSLVSSEILISWQKASFLPPVPDPTIILSVGMNYHAHLEEMQNAPALPHPPAFLMTHPALNGSGKPILVPPQCPDMIDFEGELCLVFGRHCHNVPESDAMDYVAGYTIANDVSARDWVAPVFKAEKPFEAISAWDRNLLGKQLPTFCPCGPVIVTKDEIADPHNLQLTLTLNGEVMQSSRTDDLIFNLPQIISYFSKWYRFSPGDIVTTGSPPGVGAGRTPPVYMKPGDLVEVEIEGIGKLSSPVSNS
ncbi:MAG: fumarylacetoacetate hydrolase family protein [Alphaproteobacteria bacterium]|nr:fumarylacetoacetate hydrolase family protein [Alphaproteobacteria bacterium]